MSNELIYPGQFQEWARDLASVRYAGTCHVGAGRMSVKRPSVAPVIETLPSRSGPPPDVLGEWSGISVPCSCSDPKRAGRTQDPGVRTHVATRPFCSLSATRL
jgi:hypothetical protein